MEPRLGEHTTVLTDLETQHVDLKDKYAILEVPLLEKDTLVENLRCQLAYANSQLLLLHLTKFRRILLRRQST